MSENKLNDRRDFFKNSGHKISDFLDKGSAFGVGKYLGGALKNLLAEKPVEVAVLDKVLVLQEGDPIDSKGLPLSGEVTCMTVLERNSHSLTNQKQNLVLLGHDQTAGSKALITVLDFIDGKHSVSSSTNYVLEGKAQIPIEDTSREERYFSEECLATAKFFLKTPWNSVLLFENWCCEIFPERFLAIRRGVVGRTTQVVDALLVANPGQRIFLYLLMEDGQLFRFMSTGNLIGLDVSKNQELLSRGVLENISELPEAIGIRAGYFSGAEKRDLLTSGGFFIQALPENKGQGIFY